MFSPASSPLRRRARLAVLVLSALLLFGACTGRREPTKFGKTTETNFTKTCVPDAEKSGVSDPRAYCKCAYDAIIDQMSFDQFHKLNADLADDPDVLPPKLLKISEDCARTSG